MVPTNGYAAQSATTPVAPFSFEHREPGPHDILIDIEFCGICHSDIHQARNEWGNSLYPMVPGHEIVGTIAKVGTEVRKFKVGDRAAVGCMVDSCRTCDSCVDEEQQYCDRGQTVFTYNSRDRQGNLTFGGYASHIVLDETFALSVPQNLDPAATAPLLCAGITTYSPLKFYGVGPGKRVGVIGLGGLGHMALKFSHAFGASTVLFTTSANKIEDAKKLGADEVILTRETDWVTKVTGGKFDLILDCVSADHDINPYLNLLKRNGTLCTVGAPEDPLKVSAFSVFARKNFSGSMIGGIRETQEMLDFCGIHNIVSDIELTSYDRIAEAWDRVLKSDVKYRFVLDNKTIQSN